jgi:hypothetical protein
VSSGRRGPQGAIHFSYEEVQLIARTIRSTPEVVVKVTGGGTQVGGVAAHVAYIGRRGEFEIETDEGERVQGRDAHKALIKDWHLELSRGQYRRPTKLVHNLVLSMPASTPPEKLLAAARTFAREKFAVQHRYAMVLHTDQRHPHVHLVVKAERELGQERLHITNPMLRGWRADFAQALREQGIAANATPSVLRGRTKRNNRDGLCRAQSRGASTLLRSRVRAIADEFAHIGTIQDPARPGLLETRNAVRAHWARTAEVLEAQGEARLADKVRDFARQLPAVLTDKERLAMQFARHLRERGARAIPEATRRRDQELAR